MKLYLFKCRKGYIKKEGTDSFAIVSLEKASVFKNIDCEELSNLKEQLILSEIKGACLVMLTISEKIIDKY